MAKRTPAGYLQELDEIAQKLGDFLVLIDQGKTNYFKEVALKLRVLYCWKSGNPSLLKKISDLYNFQIYVMVLYTMDEKIEHGMFSEDIAKLLKDCPTFEQLNSVVSWLENGDMVLPILEAIGRPEISFNSETYSYKNIIEVAADKMTAHIDEQIPDRHLEFHNESLLLLGLPIAQRALYDTARTTIQIINAILKHIKEGEEYPFLKSNSTSTDESS